MKDGEYKFNPNILGAAHFWCQKSVENDMKAGKNVIVSNTSLTPKERRPYIKLAKDYGYEIEVIECNGGFKNIHGVPDETIERMKKKYKPFEKWELDVK
jgi:predicted kinase